MQYKLIPRYKCNRLFTIPTVYKPAGCPTQRTSAFGRLEPVATPLPITDLSR
jgi:hypothetical protein